MTAIRIAKPSASVLALVAALAAIALAALLAAPIERTSAATRPAAARTDQAARHSASHARSCKRVRALAKRGKITRRALRKRLRHCHASSRAGAKQGSRQTSGGRQSSSQSSARQAGAAPAAAVADATPVELPAGEPSTLYWGAWIGPQRTGTEAPWDMSAVSSLESSVGKPLSLVHFAAPFADCSKSPCSTYSFPTTPMNSIREHGAIPFFSWSSQSTPSSLNEPDFQLSDVINGTYDSYIRQFATEAARWGHPFFLRFDWEMNGNWFPWSEGVNGNGAGEYVAAWRHVHDIFESVGATNATWTWCPNVDPGGRFQNLAALYPGDEYVDWTCLDGYNWGGSGWIGFDQLFGPTYKLITQSIAPSKPLIIGEVGSSENGGSKAQWIAEMLRDLPTRFPRVRGVIWFDKYIEGDWPIETSPSAESAFASGIQSPYYLGNEYGSLPAGRVPVPG